MKRLIGLFVPLAMFTACSKTDSGGAAPGASSAPVASAASAPSAAPAPAKAAVGLPAGVKMSAPKTKQLGGKSITADVCKLDKSGTDMQSKDFTDAIRGLAPAPDGGVYVVDHEGKIRKYLVQSASPCELALDAKFGHGGILALDPDPKKSNELDTVQIDSKGTLYASGGNTKVRMITPDGTIMKICDDTGHFLVDRVTNDMYFNGQKVTVNGAKCDGKDMKYAGWLGASQPDIIDAANGVVFVNGSVGKDKKSTDKIGVYKPDGTKVALFGDLKGDGDICYAAGAQTCGIGQCVYDSNCRSLRAWTADGSKLVGAVDLNEMFGVSYSWPVKLVVLKDTSWAIFSQQGEGDKAPNYGFIARIAGLS